MTSKNSQQTSGQVAFDFTQSAKRAEDGMALAAQKYGDPFQAAALFVIAHLAATRDEFFADDFWEMLSQTHPQFTEVDRFGRLIYGDASGAAFQKAYRDKIIRKTGRTRKSARPHANAKVMPIVTGRIGGDCPHCGGTGKA